MEEAWLAHYSVRSAESMLLKLDRGDAVRPKRMQPNYARKRSAAEELNTSMQDHAANIRAGIDALVGDAELLRLHKAAVKAHRSRIEALKSEPEMLAAWEIILRACRSETAPPPRQDPTDADERL